MGDAEDGMVREGVEGEEVFLIHTFRFGEIWLAHSINQ